MSNDHKLRCPDCGAEEVSKGDNCVTVKCGREYPSLFHTSWTSRTPACYERKERQLREALEGCEEMLDELEKAHQFMDKDYNIPLLQRVRQALNGGGND